MCEWYSVEPMICLLLLLLLCRYHGVVTIDPNEAMGCRVLLHEVLEILVVLQIQYSISFVARTHVGEDTYLRQPFADDCFDMGVVEGELCKVSELVSKVLEHSVRVKRYYAEILQDFVFW